MKPSSIRLVPTLSAVVYLFLPLLQSGCANFTETRAINAFSTALKEANIDELKGHASKKFERKALRLSESIEDFAVLRLPKGDVEVIEVEDSGDNRKRVAVKSASSSRKLWYQLVREEGSRKWVVDDVFVRKKKDGIVSTKPVTELMDLVTTVREFLTAWDSGVRGEILEVTSPELGEVLSSMPREYLARLADSVIGDRALETKIRPEAMIDDDLATVRLPRRAGQMIFEFRKIDGEWRIDNLAVESRKDNEHIPSVRQYATVLATAATFLDAYNKNDKKSLAYICRKEFFENSLEPATFSSVPLPTAEQAAKEYQVKLESGIADFLIPGKDELIKLSLSKVEGKDSQTATVFQVDDVTIFEREGNEEKRLSSLFLSHVMVELFAESLSLRELDSVRMMSTPDFRNRVWEKLDDKQLMKLPMPDIENTPPQVVTTVFLGAVTEITVKQGSGLLVYVLKDHNGELLIDDVLMPVYGRPNSLKKTLEVMLPIQQYAAALTQGDLTQLQRLSSRDLNRAVWHNTERVPSIGMNIPRHLAVRLTTLEVSEDAAVAGLGDDNFGAKVLLKREGDQMIIDDVRLISGPELTQRVDLKETMRIELTRFQSNARPIGRSE